MCGYYNHPEKQCTCPPGSVQKYLNKVSGPLLDRIHLHVEDCLCYWENWRNQPRLYQYPAIFVFLGFYPFDHETATYGGKIRRYKYEQGLNNEKLAKLFGLWMKGRVAEWERNKRAPLARSMEKLLSIINKTAAY